MSDPVFGIVIRRIDHEPRPVIGADMSTIGLIGPADEADAAVYPLNTPVLIYSNDTTKLKKLGALGYLPDAIRGINDQLGEFQSAARMVIVRTATGTNADPAVKLQQTIANIMGDSLQGTGLSAFLQAPDKLAVTPRLIAAPGYTGQMANSLGTLTVNTIGEGYEPNETYTVTFTGGGTNATIVQATAHAVANTDGEITTNDIVIDSYGAWYTSAPTVAIEAPPAGGGAVTATATATISVGANPIVASLTSILNQLVAHAVVESTGSSEVADKDWRETINSQRIIPISGGCRIMDPATGNILIRPLAPRILGVAVRRDHEKGAPFHSWANQPIQGILGPARDMKFSIVDGANEGQSLLSANIGILVRGEVGNDFAISSGGFIFVGTDVATDDPLWMFYNVTRGRDYIHLGLIRTLRSYLGRFNITGHTIKAILNTMHFFLRDLMADEHILGFKVHFRGSQNSAEEIRLGHLTVSFAAEEAPVLRKITTESARYRPAIDAMVKQLEAQLNMAV